MAITALALFSLLVGATLGAPATDFCTHAPTLQVALPSAGTNARALESPPGPAFQCGSLDSSMPGAWFALEGTGGWLNVTTCTGFTNYDTSVAVLQADAYCRRLSCVAVNDDMGVDARTDCALHRPEGELSSVSFPSAAGVKYLVFVSGKRLSSGDVARGIFSILASAHNDDNCDETCHTRLREARSRVLPIVAPPNCEHSIGSHCNEPESVRAKRAEMLMQQIELENDLGVPVLAAQQTSSSLYAKLQQEILDEMIAQERLRQDYAGQIARSEAAQYRAMQAEYETAFTSAVVPPTPSVPGLTFAGRGYDLLAGNPRDMNGLVDPGYRFPILEFSYSRQLWSADGSFPVPNLLDVTLEPSAQISSSVSVVTSVLSYQERLDDSLNFGAHVEAGSVFSARYSQSQSYQRVEQGTTSSSTTYVHSDGKVVAFRARLLTSQIGPDDLSPAFLRAVSSLPVPTNVTGWANETVLTAYVEFTNKFGTHYTTEVVMGGIASQMYSMTKDQTEDFMSQVTSNSVSADANVAFNAFQASASVNVQSQMQAQASSALASSTASTMEWYLGGDPGLGSISDGSLASLEMWAVSASTAPAPIGCTLGLLTDFFSTKYFPNDTAIAMKMNVLTQVQCYLAGEANGCPVCDDCDPVVDETPYFHYGDYLVLQADFSSSLGDSPFRLLTAPPANLRSNGSFTFNVVGFAADATSFSSMAVTGACGRSAVAATSQVVLVGKEGQHIRLEADEGANPQPINGEHLRHDTRPWPSNLPGLDGFAMVGCAGSDQTDLIHVFSDRLYAVLDCSRRRNLFAGCRVIQAPRNLFHDGSVYADGLQGLASEYPQLTSVVLLRSPERIAFLFNHGVEERTMAIRLSDLQPGEPIVVADRLLRPVLSRHLGALALSTVAIHAGYNAGEFAVLFATMPPARPTSAPTMVVFAVSMDTLAVSDRELSEFYGSRVRTTATALETIQTYLAGNTTVTWTDAMRLFVFRVMSPIVDWNTGRRVIRTGDSFYMSSSLGPIYYPSGVATNATYCKFFGTQVPYCFMDDVTVGGSSRPLIRNTQFRVYDPAYFSSGASGSMLAKNSPVMLNVFTDGAYSAIPEFGTAPRRCLQKVSENPVSHPIAGGQYYDAARDIPLSWISSLSECALKASWIDEADLFPTRTSYGF